MHLIRRPCAITLSLLKEVAARGDLSLAHKECGFGTSVSKVAEDFGMLSVAALVRIWNRLRSIVRKSASFFWRRWALR